jgi:LemA protein
MEPLYIVLGVGAIAAVWAIYTYNNFVSLVNRTKEAWSDIDVQFKRRYDLIPNLIETVKGYAAHEAGTLAKVTEMRTLAMNSTVPAEKTAAEDMLSGALKSLFAVSENYPDLKANENFVELQRELSDTENKIQAARRFYNSVVQDLNTAVQSFPSNLVANLGGFKEAVFFELSESDAAAKEPVKVKF